MSMTMNEKCERLRMLREEMEKIERSIEREKTQANMRAECRDSKEGLTLSLPQSPHPLGGGSDGAGAADDGDDDDGDGDGDGDGMLVPEGGWDRAVTTNVKFFATPHITGPDLLGYKSVLVKIGGKGGTVCSAILTLQIPAHERVIGDDNIVIPWQKSGLKAWKKYVCAQAQTIGIQFVGDRDDVIRVLAEYMRDPKRVELVSGSGSSTHRTTWSLNKTTRIDSSNKGLEMCVNGLHFVKSPEMVHEYWAGVGKRDNTVVSCKLTLQSPMVKAIEASS
jgi:hypothetical protein